VFRSYEDSLLDAVVSSVLILSADLALRKTGAEGLQKGEKERRVRDKRG
jgi:hypothetical protein